MKKYGTPTPPSCRICGVCGIGRNTLTRARKRIRPGTGLTPVSEGGGAGGTGWGGPGRRPGAAGAPGRGGGGGGGGGAGAQARGWAAEPPPTPLGDAVLMGALTGLGVYGENGGFCLGGRTRHSRM